MSGGNALDIDLEFYRDLSYGSPHALFSGECEGCFSFDNLNPLIIQANRSQKHAPLNYLFFLQTTLSSPRAEANNH